MNLETFGNEYHGMYMVDTVCGVISADGYSEFYFDTYEELDEFLRTLRKWEWDDIIIAKWDGSVYVEFDPY